MGSSALPGQNCGGRAVRGETHSTRFVTRLYLSGGDDGLLAEDIGKDSGHNVHPQGWISGLGSSMLEPLTIAFVAPLLSRSPWKAGRLPVMVEWEREMSSLQWDSTGAVRHHMFEFWRQ